MKLRTVLIISPASLNATCNRPAMSDSGRERKGVRESADRRTSRTLRSIDAAFLSLLEQHGYEGVGVSIIAREADIGRATFYEHYASKDELLRAQLRRVSGSFLRRGLDPQNPFDATPLFLHVQDVPMLYRLVVGRSAGARSLRIMQEVLEERAASLLAEHLIGAGASLRAPLTPPVTARLIVANLAALLAWWTENGMRETAGEMQLLFQSCVGSMLVQTGS